MLLSVGLLSMERSGPIHERGPQPARSASSHRAKRSGEAGISQAGHQFDDGVLAVLLPRLGRRAPLLSGPGRQKLRPPARAPHSGSRRHPRRPPPPPPPRDPPPPPPP